MRLAVAVTAKYAVIVTSVSSHVPSKWSILSRSSNEYHISLYQLICSSIGRFHILSPDGKGILAFQNL
jgi:hypothetical protein